MSSLEETSRDFGVMRYLNIYFNAHVIISGLYESDGECDARKFYDMLKYLEQQARADPTNRNLQEPGNYSYGNRLYDAAAKVHDICYFLLRGYSRVLAVDTDRGAVKIGKDPDTFDMYYTSLISDILTVDIKGLAKKGAEGLAPQNVADNLQKARDELKNIHQQLQSRTGDSNVDQLKETMVSFIANNVVANLQRLTLKAVLSTKSEGEEISLGLGIVKRFFQNFSSWNKIYNDLKNRPEVLTNLYVEFSNEGEVTAKMSEIMMEVCRDNSVVNYDRGLPGAIYTSSFRPLDPNTYNTDSVNTARRVRFDRNANPLNLYIGMVNLSATVWEESLGLGNRPVDALMRTTLYSWAGDIDSNLLGRQEYKKYKEKVEIQGYPESIQWGVFADARAGSPIWVELCKIAEVYGHAAAATAAGPGPEQEPYSYYFYNQDKLYKALYRELFTDGDDDDDAGGDDGDGGDGGDDDGGDDDGGE